MGIYVSTFSSNAINSLGVTDTIRFIQYFSSGKGDYTKERHQWLDEKTLADVFI